MRRQVKVIAAALLGLASLAGGAAAQAGRILDRDALDALEANLLSKGE